jgi:hypothetical protein
MFVTGSGPNQGLERIVDTAKASATTPAACQYSLNPLRFIVGAQFAERLGPLGRRSVSDPLSLA